MQVSHRCGAVGRRPAVRTHALKQQPSLGRAVTLGDGLAIPSGARHRVLSNASARNVEKAKFELSLGVSLVRERLQKNLNAAAYSPASNADLASSSGPAAAPPPMATASIAASTTPIRPDLVNNRSLRRASKPTFGDSSL
jgi:hypothetical protein